MVIPDENDPLEARDAILCLLKEHGYERLDLQDLGAFLHQEIVVLEPQPQKLPSLQGCVGARHSHNLCLSRHQVVDPVSLPLEELKRPALLQLCEHGPQVPEAALRHPPVLLKPLAFEEGLRGGGKVVGKGEEVRHRGAVL